LYPVPALPNFIRGRQPRPCQITHGFMQSVWHPDTCELSGSQQPSKRYSIASVVLYAISRSLWRLRRRDHLTAYSLIVKSPIDAVPARPRFVNYLNGLVAPHKLLHEFVDMFRGVVECAQKPNLALSTCFRNRGRNGRLVHVETDESLHLVDDELPWREHRTIRRFSYNAGCTWSDEPATDGHIIWLFAGSDDGGERAAAIYSILGTASLNGLNPEGYLRHVLEHIPAHPINRIEELLPWHIAEKMPQLRIAA
jgi:hypothetical protein